MQLCGSLSILWHCLSFGLDWKLMFSSPVATAEFSRFAGILSAALSQRDLFFFLILFLNFTILYWFCQISKWIHHRYTCVPHPEPSSLLPPHTIPLGRPSASAPSIQYRASNLDWRLVSYMILYMFQCHSLKFDLAQTDSDSSVALLYDFYPIGGRNCHLSLKYTHAIIYCYYPWELNQQDLWLESGHSI